MTQQIISSLEDWNICLRQKLNTLRTYQEKVQHDGQLPMEKKNQLLYNIDQTKELIKTEMSQY